MFAAAAPGVFLRHCCASGDYSAGADCGANGESLFKTAAGTRGGDVSASFAGAGASAHAGGAAFSGATAAHGHDCRRVQWRRSGRIAARIWFQALGKAHERCGAEAATGDGQKWDKRGNAGDDYSIDYFVCAEWISRVACG